MSSHGFAGKVDVSKRALVGGDALGDTVHDGGWGQVRPYVQVELGGGPDMPPTR